MEDYLARKLAANEQAQKAAAYDAAVAQKTMEDAKAQGASEVIQGLAKLQAEQAYMNTVQPTYGASVATAGNVGQGPVNVNGVTFTPRGLAVDSAQMPITKQFMAK